MSRKTSTQSNAYNKNNQNNSQYGNGQYNSYNNPFNRTYQQQTR